jgi:Na+-driven multidrug efflux pump
MVALTLPIIFENIFRIVVSSVDIIMLSSYSQEAVAAVGMVAQYIFFIQILFNVICIGTSIVLSQYLGAGRMDDSRHVAQASAVMVLVTALSLCSTVLLGGRAFLGLYDIAPSVRDFAWQYFAIFGGVGSLFTAFNMLQGTVLRAYGYTRDAMYVSFMANILNVIGNALALYGFFGLPVTGVVGVAVSSAFSQVAACAVLAWRIRRHPDVQFPLRGWKQIPRSIYRTILSIGVPTAGETSRTTSPRSSSWRWSRPSGPSRCRRWSTPKRSPASCSRSRCSIGTAVQIKTGYFVGARQPESAYRRLYRYQAVGTGISISLILLINLLKGSIIPLFTHTPEIAALTSTLLLFSIYIETGRSLNLVTIPGLKGAGDVRFPVLFGIVSMWGLMVLGGWILGMRVGLGLVGIWLAIGTDETVRGVVMLFRWRSKRWMTKAIA